MSSSPQPGAMKFYNKRVYPPSLCTTKPLPGCKGAKSEDFSLLLWEEVLCPTHRARAVTVIIRDPRDPGSPFSWSLNWSYPVLLLPTLPVTLPHCKVDEGVCVCVCFVFFQFLTWFSPPPKLEHFPSRYKEGRARSRRQVGTTPFQSVNFCFLPSDTSQRFLGPLPLPRVKTEEFSFELTPRITKWPRTSIPMSRSQITESRDADTYKSVFSAVLFLTAKM